MMRIIHIVLVISITLACMLGKRADARISPKTRTFLQKELPLGVVVATPVEMTEITPDGVMLSGRQAITAVFTRPVIALGSDFEQAGSQQKIPFSLSCGFPGKLRWVTTTIARYDPDVDWPTDLDCALSWATGLTSYDGAILQLGDVPSVRSLTSRPLNIVAVDVLSEQALTLTDDLWMASINSGPPEVPPDGRIVVDFGYDVNLLLLKSALKLVEGVMGDGAAVAFDIGPCQTPARWIHARGRFASTSESSSSAEAPSLDVNTTCVQITPKSQLKPGTTYLLRMLAGARYHALAGPLRQELNTSVTGLRPFELPFVNNLQRSDYGTSYRRLDVWLPHGLSPDVTAQALAQQISLCELPDNADGPCVSVPFDFKLLSRGKARLSVPTLQPDTEYKISVSANPGVKDGFGQGLQASSLSFWTSAIQNPFSGPITGNLVVMLEPGLESLSAWPFVTRNPLSAWRLGWASNRVVSLLHRWDLDLANPAVQAKVATMATRGHYFNYDFRSVFGEPSVVVNVPAALQTPTRSRDAQWTQLLLPLLGTGTDAGTDDSLSQARLVSPCCTDQGNAADAKLVLNSSLSFSLIRSGQYLTAWVQDAAAGGGPVVGARVSVYMAAEDLYNGERRPDAVLIAECTTDVDGLCGMTTSAEKYRTRVAFAVSSKGVAMLGNGGILISTAPAPTFVGSLVADRKVVVPGDTIKITGFVQRATAEGPQLPRASFASLSVYPPWESGAGSGSSSSSSGGRAAGFGVAGPRRRRRLQNEASETVTSTAAVMAVSHTLTSDAATAAVFADPMGAVGGSSGAVMGSVASTAAKLVMPMLTGTDSIQAMDVQVVMKLNGTTGTLHGEIPVPKGARLRSYTVQLRLPEPGDAAGDLVGPTPDTDTAKSWSPVSGATFEFTVADPRPPTAELKLETTPWVAPTGVIVVNVTAVSYIGASVGGSPLTLTWRHSKAAGVVDLRTDGRGFASASIDLGALPEANRTREYDNVAIKVEWIGPTRERITQSASVILANGPARVELSLSLSPNLPGTAFAVATKLTSNVDGKPILGVPVTVTLRPAASDNTAPCAAAAAANPPSCTATSGEPFSPTCLLALPCLGHFVLEACAQVALASDSGGSISRVCSNRTMGRNATEWAAAPLSAHEQPTLFSDKASYSIGEEATLLFQSPWPAARLLVHWGNTYRIKSKIIKALPTGGLAQVRIGPLGDECLGGCSVLAVLDVPRPSAADLAQLPPLPAPDQLAVSRLFDPYAPHTHSLSLVLDVRPDNKLGVSVELAAESGSGTTGVETIVDADGEEVLAIEPGAVAEVTVTVTSGSGADAIAPATAGPVEVTVYGVDKAFLDLLPYDLPRPEQEVLLRLAADISSFDVELYRLAPGSVQAVFNKLMSRLTGIDPWLPLDTAVYGGYTAVDTPDDKFIEQFSYALTAMPSKPYYAYGSEFGGGTFVMEPTFGAELAAATDASYTDRSDFAKNKAVSGSSGASGSSGGSGGGSTPLKLRRQGDFVVTPLFATAVTGEDGRARVTFKAPQNLGTFVIRAFAADGSSAKYGSGEGKVAVRRRVSLTPSAPRFVRVGDSFEAGVVVTMGSSPSAVRVDLTVEDSDASPLTLTGATSETVAFGAAAAEGVDSNLQKEIRFSFRAASLGTARLTFTASDVSQPGGPPVPGDSLQLEVPVLGQQGDVWVATSFALTALPPVSDSSVVQWQEGMVLPAAVPGSGGLTLTAGVGYLPAIASLYDNLLDEEDDRRHPLAEPALLWATLPAVFSYYGQPLNASQNAAVSAASADLIKLTSPVVGLLWSDPSRWSFWQPERTDIYLNTWALFLAAQHGAAAAAAPDASQAADWASLAASQIPAWRRAVERQVVADAVESRSRLYYARPYDDWATLTRVRLVLGADWVPLDATEEIRRDLSLETLLANNVSLSRETRVIVSLALLALGPRNPAADLVAETVKEITSALRVQGRTAYVAAGPGAAAASSLAEQAFALLLLLRSGAKNQLLPKLAAYVANPVTVGYGIFTVRPAWTERGLAVAALSEYDRARGSSRPDVELVADVNGLVVLEASFQSGRGSLSPVSNTTAWEDLPPAPRGSTSELSFEAIGSGEVTVAASLRFVPVVLPSSPTYRGLYVESALQLVDPLTGRPKGRRLAAVPLGSIVAYTIQVTTPDDLGAVTLQVLMPGGLEPLDPNVAQGVNVGCSASWVDGAVWGSFFRWWWWPVCPAQETRPSVVTFSYLALRAGTSSVTITAVAATAGTFVIPPIKASADLQPELLGLTAAGSITVCANCSGPTYGSTPPPVNACPGDCSGHGICNLRSGRCRCDAGFSRSDCSRPVA